LRGEALTKEELEKELAEVKRGLEKNLLDVFREVRL